MPHRLPARWNTPAPARVRDAGEKSTGHSRCVNGSLNVASARGGTTSTGQPAFRRTSSVTEPSNRRSKPVVP